MAVRDNRRVPTAAAQFVRAHTRLCPVPYVGELRLHLADEPIELWEQTELWEQAQQVDQAPQFDQAQQVDQAGSPESGPGDSGQRPPPFWAFAWAGGQALARHLLDDPDLVAGRSVLDLATGSGLVALAAARAGASTVIANDIDPLSLAATQVNADANGVRVITVEKDLLDPGTEHEAGVVLAGDVFYSRDMAARVLPFLRRAADRGALVLVGDPGRAYLPTGGMIRRAAYDVPVSAALETVDVRRTTVWQVTNRP